MCYQSRLNWCEIKVTAYLEIHISIHSKCLCLLCSGHSAPLQTMTRNQSKIYNRGCGKRRTIGLFLKGEQFERNRPVGLLEPDPRVTSQEAEMHPWHHTIHSVGAKHRYTTWKADDLGSSHWVKSSPSNATMTRRGTSRATLWDNSANGLEWVSHLWNEAAAQQGSEKTSLLLCKLDEDVCTVCVLLHTVQGLTYEQLINSPLPLKALYRLKEGKFRCSFTVIISLKTQALQVLSDYLHRPDASIATTSDFT